MMGKKAITALITGNGKGKTTSAFGWALRALGWDKKVMVVQFFKKGQFGEIKAINKFKKIKLKQFGKKKLVNFKKPTRKDQEEADKAWEFSRQVIKSQKYDLVILDEINLAIYYKLINKNSVIKTIKEKPNQLTLILTGRKAKEEIIKEVDLVSKIKNIKHPFNKGRGATKGVEY